MRNAESRAEGTVWSANPIGRMANPTNEIGFKAMTEVCRSSGGVSILEIQIVSRQNVFFFLGGGSSQDSTAKLLLGAPERRLGPEAGPERRPGAPAEAEADSGAGGSRGE